MKISLIQPSRNNLKYLKWSYKSIRKNQGNHEVEICVADDFSDKDNTWDWCEMMMREDPLFKAIKNEGPNRLGHTILYDKLVNEVAISDVCMIWHADMYLCPGALDAIEKHMYNSEGLNEGGIILTPKEKTIVSLTRIEPPLHPPGPEKILLDCGIEPEEFDEGKLLNKVDEFKVLHENDKGITEGIFAPWAFWKKDFQEIGGHDPLYAPQSKEDSDIFNRFQLNGIKFIQTWEGFVYHMTCRGSRFADGATRNPDGQVFMKNRETDEWLTQNQKATRNFIRKWGHFVKHDEYLKPIIPPKYDVGFVVHNCNKQLLHALEPWCSTIYINSNLIQDYIQNEQQNSKINLKERVKPYDLVQDYISNGHYLNNILVEIDSNNFNQQDHQIISQLSEIIHDSGEIGEFHLGNLKLTISNSKTFEHTLIKI